VRLGDVGIATRTDCPEAEALMDLLRNRRPEVARHSEVVAHHLGKLARALDLGEERSAMLETAGRLHDIGKIAVPPQVLSKPGPLDEVEWGAIKLHPGIGADLLHHHRLHEIARWVRAHHERLDGRGYPMGLEADEIDIEARALTVVDAYFAMRSARPYRPAMIHDEAVAELVRCSGTQFDGRVVAVFLDTLA
jgi:HD-GYP domain-containing protein (c-di-GMP phosphodiesterase class II)